MKNIKFTKMSAAGNDFVVVEDSDLCGLAGKICDRRYGIGADGMLLLEKTVKADIRMRIFNPDGSEVDMCGNGARCAAVYYTYMLSAIRYPLIKIETKAGILEAKIDGDMVKLKMSDPHSMKLDISLVIARNDERKRGVTKQSPCSKSEIALGTLCLRNDVMVVNFINTGVPHAVIFVDDLENIDVDKLGRAIRNSERFAPKGANVDFVKVLGKDKIAVRTYERGVEAETLACGTGCVAAAILSGAGRSVDVVTHGGEILKVCFEKKGAKVSNVWLEGSAKIVYKGRMEL